MYDFHKAKGESGKAFYHPSFQRGQKHLMKNIRRKATTLIVDAMQSKSESITSQSINELVSTLSYLLA